MHSTHYTIAVSLSSALLTIATVGVRRRLQIAATSVAASPIVGTIPNTKLTDRCQHMRTLAYVYVYTYTHAHTHKAKNSRPKRKALGGPAYTPTQGALLRLRQGPLFYG